MRPHSITCFGWIELTHPLLMLFGLAALLPVLIHYWHRQNHVRMNWAATHYLSLALKKVGRKYSILQWILLLIRVLLILILVASLTAPSLRDVSNLFSSSKKTPTLHLILIDRSMSMSARNQDLSRIEEAKRVASEIVESANEFDGFALFFLDDRLSPGVPLPVSDPNIVKAVVDGFGSTQKPLRLIECLEQLTPQIQLPQFRDFEEINLHMISDFQSRDWPESRPSSSQSNSTGPSFTAKDSPAKSSTETGSTGQSKSRFQMAWNNLVENVDHYQLYSAAKSNLSNNLISRIVALDPLCLIGKPHSVQVELKNHGGETRQNLTVELLVNEQVVASKQASLDPNNKTSVGFDIEFDRTGEHYLEARINSDSLAADNQRFLAVECQQKYRVLFVEGRPGGSRFLQIALDPSPGNDSIFRVQTCLPGDLSNMDLNDFDVIFWDNIPPQNQLEVDRLKRFVFRGGRIILFLGDLIDRPLFNSTWNGGNESPLGLTLEKLQPIGDYQLDMLEFRSSLLQAFRGNPQVGLARLPIWAYYRMKTDQERSDRNELPEALLAADSNPWNIDIAIDNGDPLLVSRKYGAGAIALFASSSSSDSRSRTEPENRDGTPWNANETIPAFPALVQEVFANLNQIPDATGLRVGEIWIDEMELRSRLMSSSLTSPEESQIDIDVTQKNDRLSWRSGPMERFGFYRLTCKTNDQEFTKSIAVNIDPSESNLAVSSFAESPTLSDGMQTDRNTWSRNNSLQTFQWLLAAMAILLIVETTVARRFGSSRG